MRRWTPKEIIFAPIFSDTTTIWECPTQSWNLGVVGSLLSALLWSIVSLMHLTVLLLFSSLLFSSLQCLSLCRMVRFQKRIERMSARIGPESNIPKYASTNKLSLRNCTQEPHLETKLGWEDGGFHIALYHWQERSKHYFRKSTRELPFRCFW